MLSLCTSCHRHVRVSGDGAACPFCGSAVTHAPVGRALGGAITRAAIVVAAAAALTTAACSDDSNPAPPPTADAGTDAANDGGPIAMYGGPPVLDASTDDGGPIAAYGGPPVLDAGTDSGAPAPAYGAPSP